MHLVVIYVLASCMMLICLCRVVLGDAVMLVLAVELSAELLVLYTLYSTLNLSFCNEPLLSNYCRLSLVQLYRMDHLEVREWLHCVHPC